MANIAFQKVADMPESLKAELEQFLGRPIALSEEISILSLPPQTVLPDSNRTSTVVELLRLAEAREAVEATLDEDEVYAAIDKAASAVRYTIGSRATNAMIGRL